MPCGQICKEILDGGAAAHRSFSCMSNTIMLGGVPSQDASTKFLAAAEAYALAAQAVVASCHTPPSPAT